ncbi:hypothetical protein K8M07_03205 [Schnuerera sp. xch1]|uniref:hypothetical protein n=1 Tax=Schnuerera sp. xch1 TaxID=2874283 RepID=UPI001CBC9627|nr:hypothetical protein [Schnuerera sp. xch1]MBZ2174249.1 hypothetical protein [Schnuerera sp. xch1]
MKIGFSKDGLKLNSKKFNPLNIPLKGVSIESDIPVEPVSASNILSVFEQPNIREVDRTKGIEVLKSIIDKVM